MRVIPSSRWSRGIIRGRRGVKSSRLRMMLRLSVVIGLPKAVAMDLASAAAGNSIVIVRTAVATLHGARGMNSLDTGVWVGRLVR